MTVPHRKALQPRFQRALAEGTRAPSYKIAAFLNAYIEGNDVLSTLMEEGDVTKQTALRWRSKLQDIEESYLESLDSIETGSGPASSVERAKQDPTSRDYILTALGAALQQAEDSLKPESVARIARQISDIQGFKAKEMGRQYDPIQELGDEGIAIVDKQLSLRIHAIGEHTKFFPETVEVIQQFQLLYLTEDGNLKVESPKSPPEGANADSDTHSDTPFTDQISTPLAAQMNSVLTDPSSSSSPDDDPDTDDTPLPDDSGLIIHTIDDVMEDLT